MATPHRISNSNDIRSGAAASADRTKYGAPLIGAEAQPFVVLHLGAPEVEDPNGLVEGYTGGAGVIPMDGAIADANTDANGHVVLDVPRAIVVDSGGADTAVITVTGYDVYGHLMIENITLNGTSAVNGKKAFKKIASLVAGGTVANGAFIGTTKILGLPYAPVAGGFLSGIADENTSDAGTYVAPVRTDPATATTGDVRGTYTPAGTLNGSLAIAVRVALNNGPLDSDLFGVEQYDG